MEKKEVPQDKSNLSDLEAKELCYAVNEDGIYTTVLSSGWDPKTIALDNAMNDIKERTTAAKRKMEAGEWSPIPYFMELNKMDLPILASYVSMFKWRVKRHFKPKVFRSLSDKILQRYADAFNISLEELKNTAIGN